MIMGSERGVQSLMNEWMNEWMNEGVLIRYLGKWMPSRRLLGLGLRGGARWGELSDRWGVGVTIVDAHVDSYFRFWTRFFAILERFWNDFGRFSGTKMEVKIDLWQAFQKTSILKSLFFLEENCYFLGFGPQIQWKFDAKSHSKIYLF